jgi:hypothetical protein
LFNRLGIGRLRHKQQWLHMKQTGFRPYMMPIWTLSYNNEYMVDVSLSHLNQWIIDCVEKCQDAIFIEGQGDVCSININN